MRLTVCKTPDTTYLLYMGSQPTECMGTQDGFLQGQCLYSGYIWLIRLGSTLPNMSFGFCSRVVNAVGQSNLTESYIGSDEPWVRFLPRFLGNHP